MFDRDLKKIFKYVFGTEDKEKLTDDFVHNLNLTGVPDDHFLTQVYLRRAEYMARDLEKKYMCPGCGHLYNKEDNFVKCMEEHIKDFLAGIPIRKEKKYIDLLVEQLPESMREKAKEEMMKDCIDE